MVSTGMRFILLSLMGLWTAFAACAGNFTINPHGAGGSIADPDFSFGYFIHGAGWLKCGKIGGVPHARVELPPADGKVAFESIVEDGVSCACEMSTLVTNGALRVAYRAVVTKGGRVETVSVQAYADGRCLVGGRLLADGKSQPLPKTAFIECGTISSLRLESSDGSQFLDLTFDSPVIVTVMRKEGQESYTLRLSAVRAEELAVGQTLLIGFTLRTARPIENPNTPWIAQPGAAFVPLTYRADVQKGSALDFSRIVPRTACGTYGRLRATGGHFEFERLPGIRQKFYGVNLHSYACYYTPEEADLLTDRLVRLGYNAIRLHNFENEYMGLTKGSPDGATPVAAQFEGLDNLLAACSKRGIYVTLDLHVGRNTSFRAIGIDRPGMVHNGRGNRNELKYQYLVNPAARDNLKRFVGGFFNHVNPLLGRRYADEPTIALVNVVNESPCAWSCGDGTTHDMCRQEHAFMQEMRTFIRREVGSDVPLSTCNGGTMPFCLQSVRSDLSDYVDDHFYYDHPSWPDDAKWTDGDRVPLFTPNRRVFSEFAEIPVQALTTRLWGKPFVISEFNWCAPSAYRASSGLTVGALAAAQDWDGIWRYLWAHDKRRALESGSHALAKLEGASDALAVAADRALMCLFLRGDLKPLARRASLVIPRSRIDNSKSHDCVWQNEFAWPWAGWYVQFGSALDVGVQGSIHDFAYPADVKLTADRVEGLLGSANLKLADGAVTIGRTNNSFTVSTPRTCGGSVESGVFRAGPLAANCGREKTTIWVSSLDESPLGDSSRILLTHLTRLYNTGDRFADRDGRYLLQSGRPPYLMPRARARVWLKLNRPEEVSVYALDSDGTRRGLVPTSIRKGSLAFTCDTARDAANATYLYELIRNRKQQEKKDK